MNPNNAASLILFCLVNTGTDAFSSAPAFVAPSTITTARRTFSAPLNHPSKETPSVASRTSRTSLAALAINSAQEGPWKAYLDDETTGLIFYYNHQTGESKWEPPSSSFPPVQLTEFLQDRTRDVREAYLSTLKNSKKNPFQNIPMPSISFPFSRFSDVSGEVVAEVETKIETTASASMEMPRIFLPFARSRDGSNEVVPEVETKIETAASASMPPKMLAFLPKKNRNIDVKADVASMPLESDNADASKLVKREKELQPFLASIDNLLGKLTSTNVLSDLNIPSMDSIVSVNGGGKKKGDADSNDDDENNLPKQTKRETKFDFAQRIESTKAGLVGLISGSSVLLPFNFLSAILSDTSNRASQFGLDTAIGGVESALFAIVYRYCVRDGEESNDQLGNGVAGAFAVTRALSLIGGNDVDLDILPQIALGGVESLILFYAAKAAMDTMANKGLINRMD